MVEEVSVQVSEDRIASKEIAKFSKHVVGLSSGRFMESRSLWRYQSYFLDISPSPVSQHSPQMTSANARTGKGFEGPLVKYRSGRVERRRIGSLLFKMIYVMN